MPGTAYQRLKQQLQRKPKTWLVTGAAGFIGSNLVESLLALDQPVLGVDNFATGHRKNLEEVRRTVGPIRWRRFRFHRGDLRSAATCKAVCAGVDYVLHQAALGSVPRSVEEPSLTHAVNVTAFLNILIAARDAGVRGFVYASSSAVYGDDPRMPKHEHQAGAPLSPYAATKSANELYAAAFCRCYGLSTVGLRYFNVFGPRQDPGGAYAAVIPAWIAAMIQGQPIRINGDGRTSRDFCHVANVVQANLLAATTVRPEAVNTVYNVAVHHRTTLNQLFRSLRSRLAPFYPHLAHLRPIHGPARAGDVRHSYADISRARRLLGYRPTHDFERGLDATLEWYRANLGGAGDESGQVRRSKRG